MTIPTPSPLHSICIVVPAYNEERRFDREALCAFLASNDNVRFVLVNDGSTDNTRAVLEACAAGFPDRIKVMNLASNMGKAEAVRRGMLEALGDPRTELAGYWDADWATPLASIDHFAACLHSRSNVNLVLGARVALLGRAIERKAYRHYLGRVSATGASLTLGLPVYDTQCGAKLMRNSEAMRELFATPFRTGWIFDVELIARYQRAFSGSEGLYELPVDAWTDVGESRVKPSDFIRAFGDLVTIYRQYRLPARYHRLFDVLTSRFTRYAGAGALGTAGHYLTLITGVELLGIDPPIATGLGAAVGAIINYLLNYHFIFTAKNSHRETVPRFAAVALLGIGLNAGLLQLCTTRFGIHYLLSQLLATLVVLSVGYVLNKTWTFGVPDDEAR